MLPSNFDCYPSDLFIDQEKIQKFLCPIDFNVYKQPVVDACGGHTFGKACIEKWKSKKNVCPLTNQKYPYDARFSDNLIVKDLVNELKLKCLNETCQWIGDLDSLPNHLQKGCLFQDIKCPHAPCPAHFIRESLESHEINECEFIEIKCIFEKCGEKFIRKDLLNHLLEKHFKEIKEIASELENRKKSQENFQNLKVFIDLQKKIDFLEKENLSLSSAIKIFEKKIESLEDEKNNFILDQKLRIQQEKDPQKNLQENEILRKKIFHLENSLQKLEKDNNYFREMNANTLKEITFKKETDTKLSFENQFINPYQQNKLANAQFQPIFPPSTSKFVPLHSNPITSLLLISSSLFFISSYGSTLKVFSFPALNLLQTSSLSSSIACFLYISEENKLLTGSMDGNIDVWIKIEGIKIEWKCDQRVMAHEGKCAGLKFLSNMGKFISVGEDKKVMEWTFNNKNSPTSSLIATLNFGLTCLEVMENGSNQCDIYIGDEKGFIHHIKYKPNKYSSYTFGYFSNFRPTTSVQFHSFPVLKIVIKNSFLYSCAASDSTLNIYSLNPLSLWRQEFLCQASLAINDILL